MYYLCERGSDDLLIKKLYLDIASSGVSPTVGVQKMSVGDVIEIYLRRAGVPYAIPAGMSARVLANKPDSTSLYNDCAVDGDRVIFTLSQQTIACAGVVECQLRLTGNGEDIFLPRFDIVVAENIDTDVESSDEYGSLLNLIERFNEKENVSNKVESLTSGYTSESYPSAAAVRALVKSLLVTNGYVTTEIEDGEVLFTVRQIFYNGSPIRGDTVRLEFKKEFDNTSARLPVRLKIGNNDPVCAFVTDSNKMPPSYIPADSIVFCVYDGKGWRINTSFYDLIFDRESIKNKTPELSQESTDEQYPSAKCVYDAYAVLENSIGEREEVKNRVTELSAISTDEQYPSAKCVYDSLRRTFPAIDSIPDIALANSDESSNEAAAARLACLDICDSRPIFIYTGETDENYTRTHIYSMKCDIEALEYTIEDLTPAPEKGEKGDKGDKGNKGDKGEKGDKGADGTDGADGRDGNDGYTPERGVDYWTADDIAAIKSYVDTAILEGEW